MRYLAIADYVLGDHEHGAPEARLEEFLTAAGIAHEALGGGVALKTGERDYEIAFEATEEQHKLVELYIHHTGMTDVWELVPEDEA